MEWDFIFPASFYKGPGLLSVLDSYSLILDMGL